MRVILSSDLATEPAGTFLLTGFWQHSGGEMQQASGLGPSGPTAEWRWEKPLQRLLLKSRPNRFVLEAADATGETVSVFLPNTGRLQELLQPGAELAVSRTNRQGKTSCDAQLVRNGAQWVILDNRLTMHLVAVALQARILPGWSAWADWRREAPCGRHRLDFASTDPHHPAWLEVKASNLVIDGTARFPGAPSTRAVAHLQLLTRLQESGQPAGVVFVVGRSDARAFGPHAAMDPAFAAAFADAAAAGVRLDAYPCEVDPERIRLWCRPLPVVT
jgi:sugar fermentation stimulation protein